MRVLRLAVLSICAVLFGVAFAHADSNTGIVYVHVMDAKSGKPVGGWTVQITGRDGDSQALTGSSGQATFLAVMPGMARVDVLQRGQLGACPAIITVSANEQTIVNVHVKRAKQHETGCTPGHAHTMVKPGVTSDVYDIY
jgi:hypothetical protein